MDRITLLASLAKDASFLVDVGCDHGYVAIKALKEYNVGYACLTDINSQPLEQAKKNVLANNLTDRVSFLLSNGLEAFDGNMDTVIIAGMGGFTIKDIMKNSLDKFKHFKKIILSPQSEQEGLRKFLIDNRFSFDYETMIKDDRKYYEVIVCHYDHNSTKKYSLLDYKYGPILKDSNDEAFIEYITRRESMLKDYLTKASDEVSKSKLKVELACLLMLRGYRNGKKL